MRQKSVPSCQKSRENGLVERKNGLFEKNKIFPKKVLTFFLSHSIIIYVVRTATNESLLKRQNGSLAQLGEHLPYKQRVTGSSPVTPTNMAW